MSEHKPLVDQFSEYIDMLNSPVEIPKHFILDMPMSENEIGAKTIRQYLLVLLRQVWVKGEGFSGKRPFGNSDWEYDLYKTLADNKVMGVGYDAAGCITNECVKRADEIILAAIDEMIVGM